MTHRFCAACVLCVAIGGCVGPLDRTYDDPQDRTIGDQGADRDRLTDGVPAARVPGRSLAGIDGLDRLSVDDAIRVAIANSPVLASAAYRIDAASGRVTQAGLHPNPSFVFGGEGLGSSAGRGGETTYRIEQELVLGGRLSRARGVAESDRRAARAGALAEEFTVASRVSRAYYAAAAARGRVERRRELVELAGRLRDAVAAQVRAGSATVPDRLRAEVVAEQAGLELQTAGLAAEGARRALEAAIGTRLASDLVLSTPIDRVPSLPGYDELVEAVLEGNGRVVRARLSVERARRVFALARARGAPDLVASVGPRYSDIDSEATLDVGLGIEIPIFDRNQGAIRAAAAERLSAAADLHGVRQDLLAEVSLEWSAYERAKQTWARYHERIIPKAERTLELTLQSYRHGKTDYLRLLDAQQVVVESRIASVDALLDLHEAAARLRGLAQTDAAWREAPPEATTSQEANP